MILGALSMLRAIPHRFIIWGAVLLTAYTLGNFHGNYHATEAARIRDAQANADRQRENNRVLFEWKTKTEARLKAEREQERKADQVAHEVYQQAIRASSVALRNAGTKVAALTKDNSGLRGTVDGLRNVNELLAGEARPNPGCVLSGELRVSINGVIDSINNRPNAGPPQTLPAVVAPGSNPDSQPLTCGQLASSLVEVLQHDATVTAWLLSFQSWATEALK